MPLTRRNPVGDSPTPPLGDCPVGIDRVAASAPLYDLPSLATWDKDVRRNRSTWRKELRVHGAPVWLSISRNGSGSPARIRCEYNPRRLSDPMGWQACPVDDFAGVFDAVAEAVERAVPVVLDGSAVLRRLDVVRDFETEDASFFIEKQIPLRRRFSRRTTVYFNPVTSRAETLYVGGKRSFATLYDKRVELARRGIDTTLVPDGTLRFEIRAGSRWLEKYGAMEQVSDVTPDAVHRFARDRWSWSRFGTTLAPLDAFLAAVRLLDVPAITKCGIVGDSVFRDHGLPMPLSAWKRGVHDRALRQLDLELVGEAQPALRLDFEMGRAVMVPM